MISKITAMMIASNETDVVIGGPNENLKYCGSIWIMKDGNYHALMLSSDYVFDSSDAARSYLEGIVKQTKESEITNV